VQPPRYWKRVPKRCLCILPTLPNGIYRGNGPLTQREAGYTTGLSLEPGSLRHLEAASPSYVASHFLPHGVGRYRGVHISNILNMVILGLHSARSRTASGSFYLLSDSPTPTWPYFFLTYVPLLLDTPLIFLLFVHNSRKSTGYAIAAFHLTGCSLGDLTFPKYPRYYPCN